MESCLRLSKCAMEFQFLEDLEQNEYDEDAGLSELEIAGIDPKKWNIWTMTNAGK